MIVVAGVSGHVGSVVAKELLDRGKRVKVLVRDPKKGEVWSAKGADVAVASVDNEAALTAALQGATGLFILLPPNFAAPDYPAWQRSTAATIAKAVAAAKVPHVVMLSSIGADQASGLGPITGLHHLEKALGTTGTTLTAIRSGMFQEVVENALQPAQHMGVYLNFGASSSYPLPLIATKDIAKVVADELIAGPRKSEIIVLQGPTYTIDKVAEKLGAALGKALQVINVPPEQWQSSMEMGGVPSSVAASLTEMYHGMGKGLATPKGDRMLQGTTELDETLQAIVR